MTSKALVHAAPALTHPELPPSIGSVSLRRLAQGKGQGRESPSEAGLEIGGTHTRGPQVSPLHPHLL